MVGCIINRHPENNAARKFERGGRKAKENGDFLLGKEKKII